GDPQAATRSTTTASTTTDHGLLRRNLVPSRKCLKLNPADNPDSPTASRQSDRPRPAVRTPHRACALAHDRARAALPADACFATHPSARSGPAGRMLSRGGRSWPRLLEPGAADAAESLRATIGRCA